MEVILRDASTLARACGQAAQKVIDAFTAEPEIQFSALVINGEQQNEIEELLRSVSSKTMQDIDDVFDLFRAQAKIRALAYKANNERVNELIAEKETYLKAGERALKDTFLGRSFRVRSHSKHDAADIAARLQGITRRLRTMTNDLVSDTVQVPKLSQDDTAKTEDRLSEVQRRLREVSREMARANFAVSIVLPDDVVTTMRKHKIV